jgi:putative ubiquitin-RnfH superfamily antitoxin RatB of RatAB toxin-antitoxin module
MTVEVEVVYALAGEQTIAAVRLPDGATVADALAASGVFAKRPGLDAAACKVGIWGKVVPRTQVLRDRDRVEIYRPVVADPKALRREKARRQRG